MNRTRFAMLLLLLSSSAFTSCTTRDRSGPAGGGYSGGGYSGGMARGGSYTEQAEPSGGMFSRPEPESWQDRTFRSSGY